MALTARFLARERMVHADDNDVCYGFPISGEAFARELREGEHAYQRAARLPWHTCGALIAERSLTVTCGLFHRRDHELRQCRLVAYREGAESDAPVS